ncbi:(2Fe-2S)-binding protein [Paraburkholderia elongata]|uniref:2Fe-2S iron-sulfur cluster binding domain-containing protein n=1 Tax=Paraburkholderia elongata TaxID=2675747 RepID=A0A972NW89_9BURK|nr:(2Fe-2S)-binding protein [Paraburkholderia elongata]NPT59769.1 2Fe-2S iron-sulfur cluster binding domain-containing protein [Paraburkholderia elongata]
MNLNINGKAYDVDVEPEMPLLWVIRDVVGLTGTKFGCGIGMCGACSVHLDGQVVRSCVMPASTAQGKKLTTIEGLTGKGVDLQKAWVALQVPQCGYCQSGMLMAASALLTRTPVPDDAAIDEAMSNICRCGTYARIRRAIHAVSGAGTSKPSSSAISRRKA